MSARLPGVWLSVNTSGLNSSEVRGLTQYTRGPGLSPSWDLYTTCYTTPPLKEKEFWLMLIPLLTPWCLLLQLSPVVLCIVCNWPCLSVFLPRDSLQKGWEMIAICLYFFPPSTKFSGYLEGIIAKHQDESNNIIPTEVMTDHLILFGQVTVVFVPNLSKYCHTVDS